MSNEGKITPVVLQSYYYSVFASEQGAAVLNDIKLLLTGSNLKEYEGVDPLLPHNELACRTATRNAWDMIEGMTQDVTAKPMSFRELVRETVRIYKHTKKGK
jgi:hypothetical protein